MKTPKLLILLLISFIRLSSQEEKDFLFIGSSFLSYYSMPEKFKLNFEKVNGVQISVDGSLHNGYGFYHQIQDKEQLHQMLKETNYKCIIVESHRLLASDHVNKMSHALKLLRELAPEASKIVLIHSEACHYDYPRYECAKVLNEIECNIYKDCKSIRDTINSASNRLLTQFDNLTILPFFHLKELIKILNFPQQDDKYNHPTDELQEVLARFLVYWLSEPNDENMEKFNQLWLSDHYKTITPDMMNSIMLHFIDLSKYKLAYD